MTIPDVRAIAFDVYGTLVDVAGLAGQLDTGLDDPGPFISTWRQKQLEYSFIATIAGPYRDFSRITADALDYACSLHGHPLSEGDRARYLDAWQHLRPYDESVEALHELSGYQRVVLSNGAPAMLKALLANTGMASMFDAVLSADAVAAFKPSSAVYSLVPARLGIPKSDVLFVTSNGFDIAGAKAFGFNVCRIDRTGAPADNTGREPDVTVSSLRELVSILD